MKALVLWAEPRSTNLGVRALAEGTAHLLRRSFPDIEVARQGFGAGDAPVRIGAVRPQMRRLLDPRNELVEWVRQFDLVVDTGAGDSFADIYGNKRLLTMTLMREIVHRARVPLILGPQTIGPFDTRGGRLLAKRSFRVADVVMSRDSRSSAEAGILGRPVDVETTDVVFALEPETATESRDVVLNVSGLLWGENEHVNASAYRDVVVRLCRQLLADGRRVSLLAHVVDSPLADNDVPALRSLADLLDIDVEILIPTDLRDVRRLLASAEVVIGSRMHACLNALSVGRPALPLAYSRKFDPLLSALDWPFTIDLRDADDVVQRSMRVLADPAFTNGASAVRARAEERLIAADAALSQLS